MKKIIIMLFILFVCQIEVFAMDVVDYKVPKFSILNPMNFSNGTFYTETTLPQSLPTAQYNKGAKPETIDIKTSKNSTSWKLNVLGLVDIGNAGIYEAARKGRMKTIYYVDLKKERVWIPVGWIPVCFNRYITTVYGE